MSEKVTKPVEKDETTKKPVATAKKAADKTTEKKENFLKRAGKKVKKGMQEHPFWTAFGGAAVGSAATVGVGYAGKKLVNKHRQKNAYIPQENDTLDPNL